MCISPQRHAILRHLNRQKWSKHAVFCTFWLSNVHFATAACNFATSKETKVVQTSGVLHILTCKCAFRHSGIFAHFDFQMCIWPQRHAILRHLKRQKWSKHAVFCTFWLANVLFATAAYNFSASELPKVVPDPQFFNIFTSECAFRHSGVQFFSSWTSKSGPGSSVF